MRAVIVLLLLSGAAPDGAAAQSAIALEAGNRLFAEDDLEGALEAYGDGWSGSASPEDAVLAYNAGTSALRLGRLPEALLWLRRAEAAAPGDPWVRDNLAMARDALSLPPPEPPLPWSVWARYGPWAALGGIVLAWTACGLLALGRRPQPRWLAAFAVLSLTLFAAGLAAGRIGPRPAVLLEPCPLAPAAKEGLPAGSEVWVRPAREGWRVEGRDGLLCPGPAIGLVAP